MLGWLQGNPKRRKTADHAGQVVGVFDPTGRRRVSITDMVTGQLIEVRENAAANFTSSTVTTYRVRPDTDYLLTGEQRNGQPIRYAKWMVQSITQGVQTRTLRSDGLGRLVSETPPENGTTTYAWDDAGNLVLKTDARGVTTGTTYDVLGRPTLVRYSDATPSVTRVWDLGAYGIGRLHSVSNAHATSVYTYLRRIRGQQRDDPGDRQSPGPDEGPHVHVRRLLPADGGRDGGEPLGPPVDLRPLREPVVADGVQGTNLEC
jgi:YD repeat-containing protein